MTKIITDTSTLYTPAQGTEMGIDILPLNITINQKTYREFEEIQQDEFLDLIHQGHLPTSSQPAVGQIMELYEKYNGEDILVLPMADGLSGTYQACLGAREMEENKDRIHVLSTRTLCGPHRYLLELAMKLDRQGVDCATIYETLKQKVKTSKSFLIPMDFGYLKRGGRCTPLTATLGGLLNLIPVLCQTEDGTRLEKFGVERKIDQAVRKITKYLREKYTKPVKLYVAHAKNTERAQKFVTALEEAFDGVKVEVLELSCAFITQGGPGCIAIQAIEE